MQRKIVNLWKNHHERGGEFLRKRGQDTKRGSLPLPDLEFLLCKGVTIFDT